MKIPILYEDTDVLVLNKPAGLVVHADGRTVEPTVVEWIVKYFPALKGVGEERDSDRSGIVHRLDRESSGALLVAKNQTAYARLKKQFERQQVHKTYHAFVYGRVKHDEGVIDRPIARSRANPVLWSATRGRRGEERAAITDYRILQRAEETTFLELMPRTGRTHQLRVHLKAINYPIVCDKLYAPARPCLLGFTRLALHARAISFALPSSGKAISVEAPYPADFADALKRLNRES